MVIVIGREFGSGGRRIGRMVADRLSIPYYDKELLAEAAGTLGFAPEIFNQTDEKRPSPFRSVLQGVYGIADNFHTTSMSGERLYGEQSKAIRELCRRGPCVIVGRTADYVMRDDPELVSVFLHAPLDWRAEKIVRRGDSMVLEKAKTLANKMDNERENYYNYYTDGGWGKANNYHLSIDASRLPASDVADMIVSYARTLTSGGKRK